MAKILDFDKKHFNSSGVIALKRSDDWKLLGTVIEKYARYTKPLDLTGLNGATAFWPAASGGVMAQAFTVVDAKGGQFEMDVPASDTPAASVEDTTTVYAVIDHPSDGLMTLETEFAVISIQDRGFQGA